MFLPRIAKFPARGFSKRQVSRETVSGRCGPGNRPRRSRFFRTPEKRFENSIPRAQTGCTRAKKPPHYCSTLKQSKFAEWGLTSKANIVAGCSE
jgi:hypothetical protein